MNEEIVEELVPKLKAFLAGLGDDVDTDELVEAFNQIAKAEGWKDRIEKLSLGQLTEGHFLFESTLMFLDFHGQVYQKRYMLTDISIPIQAFEVIIPREVGKAWREIEAMWEKAKEERRKKKDGIE